MPTNNFITFTPTNTGTNLLTNAEYAASADRTSGNKPGVASAKLNNKAIRQSSFITSQLAQFLSNTLAQDVLDTDGNEATILAQLTAALTRLDPTIQTFSASGTFTPSYKFFIIAGAATVGATYTNNTFTFTVKETIAAGTLLWATGTGAPAVSGTLTKATGTGDATLTFYAFRKPNAFIVQALGGGGGGGAVGSGAGGSGGAGGGGGAGEYVSSTLTAAQIGASKTVTIGALGAGGSAGANAGSNGGATSLGTLVIANGGLGGSAHVSSTGSLGAQGGAGGSGGTGDFIGTAANGGVGYNQGQTIAIAGFGGASILGGGGQSNVAAGAGSVAGFVGSGKGAGGAGGVMADNTATAGGGGSIGFMSITEIF